MSRRIREDFVKLSDFLDAYTLSKYSSNDSQIDKCKAMHKKLYGLIVFVGEYNHQFNSKEISKFFNEMASDFLLSLFNWIQGMYKPAKLELRCSIENFLKAILSVKTPTVLEEKSVYEIFDLARKDIHIDNCFGEIRGEQLRNDYVILCRTAHSAPLEMHSLSALNLLPQFNEVFAQELVVLFTRIIENILGILYINYPKVVDNMHPENKKDFLDCLSKTTKKDVNDYLYG